ncbi:uroporphyrinogen decarboxylase family protein [Sunxiuqinia sp. A32]|uniref:uroporphyrinogen decarboxylase family protein n=1 Tax=Sunxiuqinia sp. A32 TaxID=3461496 RepID=UPI0040461CCE
MNKREVIKTVLDGKKPPYVPWSFKFTIEPKEQLQSYFNTVDLDIPLNNHILNLGSDIGFFDEIEPNMFQDVFKVVWDRSVDKDIGMPVEPLIKEPCMEGVYFPDPHDPRFYANIEPEIAKKPDMFRVFQIGFSLYERAWTMRGMENLLMDFMINPDFVHQLMEKIADYNIAMIEKALTYDIDAVYFGDDWGQQHGLIMGIDTWQEFLYPQIQRMYKKVRDAGKYVMIHSCGDVDELFPLLVDAGLNCFNPFQPEVMDLEEILPMYRGKLAFHGGLSMQKTLPFGTPEDVRSESEKLIELGKQGGYIFSPSHSVESDTTLENILTFIEVAQNQKDFKNESVKLTV